MIDDDFDFCPDCSDDDDEDGTEATVTCIPCQEDFCDDCITDHMMDIHTTTDGQIAVALETLKES